MSARAAEHEVAAAASRLPGLSLAELNAEAELLDRVDRKYFVSPETFARLMREHGERYSVLDIGGVRMFDYRTTYFDSPRFDLFRNHVQRRRLRYKVRVREYCDSGVEMLEVKSRGYRGRTVKTRIPYEATADDPLGVGGRRFVREELRGSMHSPEWVASLRACVVTDYRRTTFVDRAGGSRMTCDVNLRAHHGDAAFIGPDDVLIETKAVGRGNNVDRWLVHNGVRPHSVSKYCVAAALCHPQLPANPWHRLLRRFGESGRKDPITESEHLEEVH